MGELCPEAFLYFQKYFEAKDGCLHGINFISCRFYVHISQHLSKNTRFLYMTILRSCSKWLDPATKFTHEGILYEMSNQPMEESNTPFLVNTRSFH